MTEQQQFASWILSCVKSGNEKQLKQLLENNFRLLQNGNFSKEAFLESSSKIIELLDEQYIDEFKNVMLKFDNSNF